VATLQKTVQSTKSETHVASDEQSSVNGCTDGFASFTMAALDATSVVL